MAMKDYCTHLKAIVYCIFAMDAVADRMFAMKNSESFVISLHGKSDPMHLTMC